MSTAEAALGRVGRLGVGEHDEGVPERQVSPIASYREKGSILPLRKAEEPSPNSSCNFVLVHVFNTSYGNRNGLFRVAMQAQRNRWQPPSSSQPPLPRQHNRQPPCNSFRLTAHIISSSVINRAYVTSRKRVRTTRWLNPEVNRNSTPCH